LKKQKQKYLLSLCIVIFEEEPKKRSENTKKNKDFFFNTTSPGLSSLFFSNPKPISQHHTIMK